VVCRASNDPISRADSAYTAGVDRDSQRARGAEIEAIAWAVRFADRPPQAPEDVLSQLERDGLVESIAALRGG